MEQEKNVQWRCSSAEQRSRGLSNPKLTGLAINLQVTNQIERCDSETGKKENRCRVERRMREEERGEREKEKKWEEDER